MVGKAPYETLFVARQPVLDATGHTWGYFHFYRRCQEHTYSEFTDPLQATLSVIQCLPACMSTCALPHKSLIHLPPPALVTAIPKALGAACLTPVLDLCPICDGEYLRALKNLVADGYELALDLPHPCDLEASVLPLCSVVILDMRAPESLNGELKRVVDALKAEGHKLLAKRVETHAAAALARELGFDFFAGHFFREPETLVQRKISAAESTRLHLLDLLSQSEPPIDQIVAGIEADASISYRVLALLNSAHFGLLKKVSSVRQAVLLAGWVQLAAWLRVMVLGDTSPSSKSRELLHLSAQRAKFFELLARASDRCEQADSLFLLGLFSLLPAMLDMAMPDILESIALDEHLRDGLCGVPGPYAAWLGMAQAIEDTRWDDMAQHAIALGLPTGSVATAYNASFQWADTLLDAIPPKGGNSGHTPPHNL
jgi:EAL and modified HD-GYP domain-containing signal transduction protein